MNNSKITLLRVACLFILIIVLQAIGWDGMVKKANASSQLPIDITYEQSKELTELIQEEKNLSLELRKMERTLIQEIYNLQNEITTLEIKAKIDPVSQFETINETPSLIGDEEILNDEEGYQIIQKENGDLKESIHRLDEEVIYLNERKKELDAIIYEIERLERLTPTLRQMEQHDYVKNSITGLSNKKLSLKLLNNMLKKHGKLNHESMSFSEYKNVMNYQWVDKTDYINEPVDISVDISRTIDYEKYIKTLKKLSRYEGVYLYKIGTSGEGRDIYGIEIDFQSKKKKEVIMLTGQVHAREFAGGTYILKELVDLVQKAQTNKETKKMLEQVKYVAIPIINVDGRENIIGAASDWTSKGQLWKAYTNGTDGNRNYPGVSWGTLANGIKYNSSVNNKSGYAHYVGDYGGSSSETQAMMKWLYHYIIVEKANCLIDYHQQGSIIYAGKPWVTQKHSNKSTKLRQKVLDHLNKGNNQRKYSAINESLNYGLVGGGVTITDYAMGLAAGSKFSPAYGFQVFTDGKKEYNLLEIKDLDNVKFKIDAPNLKFKTLTLEIGYGTTYLGNSAKTRKLLATEYKKYHFDTFLEYLPKAVK